MQTVTKRVNLVNEILQKQFFSQILPNLQKQGVEKHIAKVLSVSKHVGKKTKTRDVQHNIDHFFTRLDHICHFRGGQY